MREILPKKCIVLTLKKTLAVDLKFVPSIICNIVSRQFVPKNCNRAVRAITNSSAGKLLKHAITRSLIHLMLIAYFFSNLLLLILEVAANFFDESFTNIFGLLQVNGRA